MHITYSISYTFITSNVLFEDKEVKKIEYESRSDIRFLKACVRMGEMILPED